MTASSIKAIQSRTVSKSAAMVASGHAGDNEFSAFDLRDTLNSITVRETNFGEFLSALKQAGYNRAKR